MAFYVRNKLSGALRLRQGRIRLAPAGQRGCIKPVREGYEKHPELTGLVAKSWVDVLTYEEYVALAGDLSAPEPAEKKIADKEPQRVAEKDSDAEGEEPVAATPPQVEESEPATEVATEGSAQDRKSLAAFKKLTRKKMASEIDMLGLPEQIDQRSSRAQMVAFYAEWLSGQGE